MGSEKPLHQKLTQDKDRNPLDRMSKEEEELEKATVLSEQEKHS